MGITAEQFYDPALVAILPMGFCYPGTGHSGDLPPRRECAPQWRARLLASMPDIRLTLLLGQYAMQWHLPDRTTINLTETVQAWRDHWPATLPLPHPSPRNNPWLKANPWFERELVPALQQQVHIVMGST
jgi:uracil-DNA glycosylase